MNKEAQVLLIEIYNKKSRISLIHKKERKKNLSYLSYTSSFKIAKAGFKVATVPPPTRNLSVSHRHNVTALTILF